MTSDQIRQLALDGFTLGGHSLQHVQFQLLEKSELEDEIVGSCEYVKQLVGAQRIPFAFPYHARGIDRELLRSIMMRNPSIESMFGSGGIARDESFIINRIAADSPAILPPGQSGLGRIIRGSYVKEISK